MKAIVHPGERRNNQDVLISHLGSKEVTDDHLGVGTSTDEKWHHFGEETPEASPSSSAKATETSVDPGDAHNAGPSDASAVTSPGSSDFDSSELHPTSSTGKIDDDERVSGNGRTGASANDSDVWAIVTYIFFLGILVFGLMVIPREWLWLILGVLGLSIILGRRRRDR